MNDRCQHQVWQNGCYRTSQCSNKAKVEVGGISYCGVHNPNRGKTKAQVQAEIKRNLEDEQRQFLFECLKFIRTLADAGDVSAQEHIESHARKVEEIIKRG